MSMPLNEFQGKTTTAILKKIELTGFNTSKATQLLTVFPNQLKSGESLHVSFPENTDLLSIYSMDGVLVRQLKVIKNAGSSMSIQTSGLLSGIYILRAKTKVVKFIIK